MNDAKDAINSSKLLFNHGLYGQSAFHAQQCVELSVKAYMLYFCPSEGDINNHYPLKVVLRHLKTKTKQLRILKSKITNPFIEDLLEKGDMTLNDIYRKMNSAKKEKHKKDLWKYSMKMSELNREDFKILKEFQNMKNNQFENEMFAMVIAPLRHQLSHIRRDAKEKLKKKLLSTSLEINNRSGDIKSEIIEIIFSDISEESIRNGINTITVKIKNTGTNILDRLYEPNGWLANIIKNTKAEKMEILTLCELQVIFHMMYIIQHLKISLLTLPHETIGRYSVDIDGQTTKYLYGKRKDKLWKLIRKSHNVFKQTDLKIKQYEELTVRLPV